MSETTPTTPTIPPNTATFTEDGVLKVWVYDGNDEACVALDFTVASEHYLTDEGVWDTALIASHNGRIILASEVDDETITAESLSAHHRFDPVSGKYRKPNIAGDASRALERIHDDDIGGAEFRLFVCRELELLHGVAKSSVGQKSQFYNAWKKAARKDWCILVGNAYVQSLGAIYAPVVPEEVATRAIAFGEAFCSHLESATITHPAIRYVERLIEWLEADALLSETDSNRKLPRGAVLVKTATEPAVAEEKTLATLIAELTVALTPAEED